MADTKDTGLTVHLIADVPASQRRVGNVALPPAPAGAVRRRIFGWVGNGGRQTVAPRRWRRIHEGERYLNGFSWRTWTTSTGRGIILALADDDAVMKLTIYLPKLPRLGWRQIPKEPEWF